MNISKFTQKSLQAVQDLEKTAYEFGNQEIEQEHLLYNLLHQEDSLILKMIEKMEIQKEHFVNRVTQALNDRVKVSGGQPYIGQYLNKALVSAEDEAKAMGMSSASPSSHMRTRVFSPPLNWGSSRVSCMKVVLPASRNPVKRYTGISLVVIVCFLPICQRVP